MKKNRKKKKQNKFVDDGVGLIIIARQPDGSTETIRLTDEGVEPVSETNDESQAALFAF